MLGKKTLRLVTAILLVGVAMGAQQVSGATVRHAPRAAASGVIAITDWQFPDGCGLVTASVADNEICSPMQDQLYLVNDHLQYVPDLAENIPTQQNGEVKIVNGNLVATYKLKPNLKWSDGTPITPQDIIFDTKLEVAIGASGIDQIIGYKVIDSRTLRVTYNGTYAPYYTLGAPVLFAPQAYLQQKYGSSDFSTIVTKVQSDLYNSPSDVFSGAYKIGSWTNGQSIVIVPNPYYNALPPATGHPRPAQIKFVNISSDESGLAAALGSSRAGVDKAEDFQASDLSVLYGGKYHITVQPALQVEHLELNEAGALKDVRLRQALQYVIDKHRLYHALFPDVKSDKEFLLPTVFANISPWRDKRIPVSAYNPAKARALIRAAGYSDQYFGSGRHLTLRFATTTAAIRQKDFGILSRYWAAVGIHVVPNFASGDPAANGGMFSPYNLNGVLLQRRYDIALFAFLELPEPQQQEDSFNPTLIPTATKHGAGAQNYNGIVDQDQWKLLQAAGHTLDMNQRHALFNKWQRLVNDRVYFIMLYARTNITANNGKIGNYRPNPSQGGNSWNAFQWFRAS